ncbi:hypothetical protein YPC_1328 [Yersinia pestis biovar Medievalis str. Harbin 35]|nr:hypothetical protein YPC_1328 [Yersinia pestis biovar Medievalis str. Harbin 35]EEO77788.1 hypothetical protein YP516_1475 [Yersinia pestis Nepal516]EEO79684.1 hypothetical protein YPF_3673 [Yersinia pestis biovar Orientalis str. India 195]EEO85056.1 hypothetical protein YPH_0894 [Yersinia pestis biovar Orientalis str. PEXU2]EEO89542.1 hypothetical protein YPS_3507 [Yersinia pestis Pestoides A]
MLFKNGPETEKLIHQKPLALMTSVTPANIIPC